jgi:hypothetical protein
MKPKNEPELDEDDDTIDESLEDREKDYSGLKYIQKQLGEIYTQVEGAFQDKSEQNAMIDECWDIYHCNLNENQAYTGNSKIYVPVVRDAVDARMTRFVNMLFPPSGRYADIVGNDGKVPYDLIALMDYYARRAKLRENVAPALMRTGDCGGQYALYPEWQKHTRCIVSKKKVAEMQTDLGTDIDGSPEYDDVEYAEDVDEFPSATVLDPRDFVILPATVDTVEEADCVGIRLRFSKAKIKQWVKDGIFEKDAADQLIGKMGSATDKPQPDTGKQAAASAGVKTDAKGSKRAEIFQIWTKLKIKGEYRMMVSHFGGPQIILGCKRNPYWSDRVPLITQPVDKEPGTIWSAPPVYRVASLQYQINDFAMMGADSGMFSMLPIVMTDPEKNPRAGSMVLAMASVWLTSPNDTKFAEFPALWKDAIQFIGSLKDQIMQSLGVNPAMLPHGNASKKPSQAQVAQEQQVALESAADNTAVIQEGILSKWLEWAYELDYQYRDKAITVKKFGQMGLQADMQQVEPFQERQRYEFKWYGTEGFKAQQQVQAMISWTNVLKELPPQLLNGRKLDLGPVLEYISEVTYGPRIAPNVLIDQRHQLSMSPETENALIRNHFPVQVHDMDDDMAHIQSHFTAFKDVLDLPPEMQQMMQEAVLARGHILEHMKAAKAKAAAAQGAQPGSQGAPAQPQIGGPRPGAVPQVPQGAQQPPGMVSTDQMPLSMPRKA